MKPLPPTLRENKRYLLLSGGSQKRITDIIRNGIGELGLSRAMPHFIRHSSGALLLAINRESLTDVRACFALSPDAPVIRKVSGTIAGLKL